VPGMSAGRRIGNSLRWRLPLLIAGLIALVVATFLAVAYREVQADLRHAAAARAVAAANQVGGLFGQSSQQRLSEFRRLASDPVLLRFLDEPNGPLREAARDRLAKFPNTAAQVIELWNDAGVRLLTVATPASADAMFPGVGRPVSSGIGPLRKAGATVFSEASVEIQASDSADDRPTNAPRGWLVIRRPATAAPTADVLNRLVGTDARIAVGNTTGDVWTNLATLTEPPRIDLAHPGAAEELGADGSRSVGALAAIRGTPWSIWVAFSDASVLAPARAFLQRMLLIAVAFLAFSTAVVAFVTARITSPLSELTAASEAIAGGEYSRRVPVNRGDEIGRLSAAFNAMTEQVELSHRELEARVGERTAALQQHAAELATVNRELEAFSYSVSHDLRAPLRHISGFAMMLEESAAQSLDADARRLLTTIRAAATRMGRLIDDLLSLSRIGRTELARSNVDLGRLGSDVQLEVSRDLNGRRVDWRLHDLPTVHGDPALLRLVLVNLLSNAVKYSAPRTRAEIEVGAIAGDGETVVFVRDNGVGFDMKYIDKLFGVFQRLHNSDEFEGTGIGLANVRRIVQRHGGRTWAEGQVDAGATFYFSLPNRSVS
jgi:signal transduction histidine kinase